MEKGRKITAGSESKRRNREATGYIESPAKMERALQEALERGRQRLAAQRDALRKHPIKA